MKRNAARKQPVEANAGFKWSELEQKRLQDLLDNGTLNVTDSAAKAKSSDEMFEKFSNNVIGYHMGLLRKRKCE